MNCVLDKDVEIFDIFQTSVNHELQMIARDEDRGVLLIITWDFDKNIETSMMQYAIEGDDSNPQYHVVRGMNLKRNYFSDDNYIFDLEFNIPI